MEVLKAAIIGYIVCALPYSKSIQATHFKFGILMVFLGKKNSVGKFDRKNISVSEMGRKKYSVSPLCLKKYFFFRKKIMSQKKNSAALRKKIF